MQVVDEEYHRVNVLHTNYNFGFLIQSNCSAEPLLKWLLLSPINNRFILLCVLTG